MKKEEMDIYYQAAWRNTASPVGNLLLWHSTVAVVNNFGLLHQRINSDRGIVKDGWGCAIVPRRAFYLVTGFAYFYLARTREKYARAVFQFTG